MAKRCAQLPVGAIAEEDLRAWMTPRPQISFDETRPGPQPIPSPRRQDPHPPGAALVPEPSQRHRHSNQSRWMPRLLLRETVTTVDGAAGDLRGGGNDPGA